MKSPGSSRGTGEEGAGASQPPIRCWFCERRFARAEVLRDGILRGRGAARGGPYRLFDCPSCGRENLCEQTRAGRWFSSPNFRFSLLDYVFSQLLEPGAEDLLAAVSWFQANEERRRYFFERDGDRRYSGGSFLRKLWPGPQRAAEGPGRARAARPETGGSSARRARGAGGAGRARREAPPGRRGVVSPYEILDLPEDASERDIHAAFHRLAIHYHPDKVHHLGEDFERVAHEKFMRLKEAYESLLARRARGRR